MKKFEIEYMKQRINEVVRCTNGIVSTRLNKIKKDIEFTKQQKFDAVKDGTAELKDLHYLSTTATGYHEQLAEAVLQCFSYPLSDKQKSREVFNKRLDNKIEEIHTEIELEGKRLVDKAVLDIVAAVDIPDELLKLGELVSLAVVEECK